MSVKRFIQVCLILVLALSSLAATTSKAQAWSGCGSTYVVQRGDWLARIARTCGVTLSQLYAANPWATNSYYIYPGQILVIPGGYDGGYDQGGPGGYYGCGPATDAYGNYWAVCRGDTLGRIAQYYGVNWRYLQNLNNIVNPNRIYPGQVIRI
ncbi:MAG: LysM peptidoglycan-binding domain-containing protein [Chloroflexota bacterium]|nr:LysM domain-containing protein [Anaerolineales bacterium]